MLTLPASVRIFVAAEPTDLRRGFDGLAAATRSRVLDPMSGHRICFLNRRKNRIKLPVWDRTGYLLLYKRLERGTFAIPTQPAPGRRRVEVDAGEPALMLEGLDLRAAHRRTRWYRSPHPAAAATVFDRLFNGRAASAEEVGCWPHGRRRLKDLRDMDCRVVYPLKRIARLFRIEHLADAKGLSPDERVALRQERPQPVLEKLKRWLAAMHGSEPPGTDLAKAVGYMIRQWKALNRFLHDGRLQLHNNLVEQQPRSVALGRNNFLFFGSHHAAARAAVLYTITRTCALRGVPPLAYLTDVLRKLAAGWPQSRLDELLPDRWQSAPVVQ